MGLQACNNNRDFQSIEGTTAEIQITLMQCKTDNNKKKQSEISCGKEPTHPSTTSFAYRVRSYLPNGWN